jgi:hypothetical protein
MSLLQPPPEYRTIAAPDSEDDVKVEEEEEEEEAVVEYEAKWMKQQEIRYKWYSLLFTFDCSATCGAGTASNAMTCVNNHVVCDFCSQMMLEDRYSSFLIF